MIGSSATATRRWFAGRHISRCGSSRRNANESKFIDFPGIELQAIRLGLCDSLVSAARNVVDFDQDAPCIAITIHRAALTQLFWAMSRPSRRIDVENVLQAPATARRDDRCGHDRRQRTAMAMLAAILPLSRSLGGWMRLSEAPVCDPLAIAVISGLIVQRVPLMTSAVLVFGNCGSAAETA
jgi:hypothetical protein